MAPTSGCGTMAAAAAAMVLWVCVACLAWAPAGCNAAGSFGAAQYQDALSKAILFYEGQRSGRLPTSQRLTWRGDSGLRDGSSSRVDLVGGYYDAGDNVKFGLPMAFTITLLSWVVIEKGRELVAAREMTHAAIRWGSDYLLKAHTGPSELYVQVADPTNDHACWQRPEDMQTDRTVYKIDASNPGSDVAAETAAALAAASFVFQATDASYSTWLLASATQLFSFADLYRGAYSVRLPQVASVPILLHLRYLVHNGEVLGGATTSAPTLSWDNKYAGAQVLAAQFFLTDRADGLQGYKQQADAFVCGIMPGVSAAKYSPTGSNLHYVTASYFLLLVYAKYLDASHQTVTCGTSAITPAQLYAQAKTQVDYILGHNPQNMSYMVGFGSNFPHRVHHRGASVPCIKTHPAEIACSDGFSSYQASTSDPNQLTGGILGGPDQADAYGDDRSNYRQAEPTTYINAGWLVWHTFAYPAIRGW